MQIFLHKLMNLYTLQCWMRHTEAGYHANMVGVSCLMWWIVTGLHLSARNFDSVSFFFYTSKFVVVRMESHNNLRLDDPTTPVKAKRKAEATGNRKRRDLF